MVINPLTQQSCDAGFQWPTPVPTPSLQPLYPDTGSQSVSVGYPVQTTAPGGVAGASTQQPQAPSPQQPQNNNGGIPGVDMSFYQGWNDQGAINADWANTWQQKQGQGSGGSSDPYAGIRDDINSGYDAYFRLLDEQMAGLGGQRTSQENIVGGQYTQGQADIGLQQDQGLASLQAQEDKTMSNQEKNLKNLTENIRNSMMAGNVYLGSRGAGDSSAGNQYAYALTKMGSKARGDVMSQTSDIVQEIGQRETNLRDTVNNEMDRLKTDRDTKMNEIATWFADSQNQIRQAQASGQLSKGTDLANLSKSLLDQAISRLNQAETASTNRREALEQWAMNNSNTIAQLKANMQQVSNYNPSMPQTGQLASAPIIDSSGGFRVYGGSANPEEEKGLFA